MLVRAGCTQAEDEAVPFRRRAYAATPGFCLLSMANNLSHNCFGLRCSTDDANTTATASTAAASGTATVTTTATETTTPAASATATAAASGHAQIFHYTLAAKGP